jgi:hypothetical protein
MRFHIHADHDLAGVAHTVADLLAQLILSPPPSDVQAHKHQAALKPITWAAQVCKGMVRRDRAVLKPPGDSLWRPTCLTLGPAPMATAGAETICQLAGYLQSSPEYVVPEDVVACIRLSVTLTTLTRRMAQEATGVGLVQYRKHRRDWCRYR